MFRYRVELLLLLGALAAALVFVLQPSARVTRSVVADSVTAVTSGARPPGERAGGGAPKVTVPSIGRSPRAPLFGTLPFTDEDRTRQLRLCMDRAKNAPTWPGDGVGRAELAHTGVAGDSLVFDGPAYNLTSGRQLVWRCAIGNWDGRVGAMKFTTLESINGVPLEWNAIAAIDEEVLGGCVAGAKARFPGREVPAYVRGPRQGDAFELFGSAASSDGFSDDWRCTVQLQQGRIASLSVQDVIRLR